MTKKPLILVSNSIRNAPVTSVPSAPRLDYIEFSHCFDADLLGTDWGQGTRFERMRTIEKRLRIDIGQSWEAWHRAGNARYVFSLSERIGIPLAMMLQVTNRKVPHVLMGHKLSSGRKARLFDLWKLHNAFSALICVSRFQIEHAVQKLGFPAERAHFVYHHVDDKFYIPQPGHEEDYIIAVGQEQRDYKTLIQALEGTNIKLVVVASSLWLDSHTQVDNSSHVRVLSGIPYTELRDLYARSRLVVVPLHDVDYAAGSSGLLEAMAMGKPTIVTRTRGITDYVEENQTALYAPPGDAEALREQILSLWDNTTEQRRLGENARQIIEQKMNMDIYVQEIKRIMDTIV